MTMDINLAMCRCGLDGVLLGDLEPTIITELNLAMCRGDRRSPLHGWIR